MNANHDVTWCPDCARMVALEQHSCDASQELRRKLGDYGLDESLLVASA